MPRGQKKPRDFTIIQRAIGNREKLGAREVVLPREEYANWLPVPKGRHSENIHTSNMIWTEQVISGYI